MLWPTDATPLRITTREEFLAALKKHKYLYTRDMLAPYSYKSVQVWRLAAVDETHDLGLPSTESLSGLLVAFSPSTSAPPRGAASVATLKANTLKQLSALDLGETWVVPDCSLSDRRQIWSTMTRFYGTYGMYFKTTIVGNDLHIQRIGTYDR